MSVDLGDVNLFSSEHKRDPFPFYARLRAETPVAQLTAPVLGKLWLVTRHEDVVACLRDSDRFVKDPRSSGARTRRTLPRWIPASLRALEENMLDVDDPSHRRLRALIDKAFSRRQVEVLRGRIETIADELLSDLAQRGTVDLLESYALSLPLTVICELLGIPTADRKKFHRWSAAFLSTTSNLKMVQSLPSMFAFVRYLKRMARSRRDAPVDDLVTALVEAEDAGDQLNEHELVAMIVLLVIAGHETTVNLIASGTLALLEAPEQQRRLVEEPALIGSAVDELLRFTAPVETATERYATVDLELGGTKIQGGELVVASLASANRDERVFPAPDDLDLSRDPNPHVAFGHGVHFCLGHQLARLEARIAFTRLFQKFPNLKLARPAAELTWRETPIVRGLKALPVSL